MSFNILICEPLFIYSEGTVEKNTVISLAGLIIIYQLLLTMICFLDVLFPFDYVFMFKHSYIKYSLQIFTTLFMAFSDIHLLLHILPICLTKK